MLVIKAGIHKMFVRITGKILIRLLLLKEQSDLGLHCLSKPFCRNSKACVKQPLKNRQNKDGSLMKVDNIAECSH